MYGYIYKTTNLINNRYYIGKHKSEFFDETYYGSGKIIKQAIQKNGKENFKVEMIESCDSLSELNEREIYYIDLWQSDLCYNIAKGGDGGDIWSCLTEEQKRIANEKRSYSLTHMSPEADKEWRRKLSEASKGRPQSEETRRKKSEALMGHKVSQETRDKISKSKKEFYQTEEGQALKQKLSEMYRGKPAWNKGLKMSEEYCQKVRESHPKGYYHHTEETKKKISEASKGRKHTQEQNDKVSAALGTWVKNVEDDKVFTSINKASKEYHIACRTISACVKGDRETAGGFHWILVDKNV